MYNIFKGNRKVFTNHTFTTYEQARSFLRKYLREQARKGKLQTYFMDLGWTVHSNPSITDYSYTIKQVN